MNHGDPFQNFDGSITRAAAEALAAGGQMDGISALAKTAIEQLAARSDQRMSVALDQLNAYVAAQTTSQLKSLDFGLNEIAREAAALATSRINEQAKALLASSKFLKLQREVVLSSLVAKFSTEPAGAGARSPDPAKVPGYGSHSLNARQIVGLYVGLWSMIQIHFARADDKHLIETYLAALFVTVFIAGLFAAASD